MAKKFADCVAAAIKGGMITSEEGRQVLDWYQHLRQIGNDDGTAKTEVARRLELEARERERRTVMMAGKLTDGMRELDGFRNAAGEVDKPLAHRLQFFRRKDEGKFIGLPQDNWFGVSLAEKQGIYTGLFQAQLEEATYEFRKGAITGDLKRTSKMLAAVVPGAEQAQARMSEVVKVMRGEKTSDPRAQQIGQMMMDTAEMIRGLFNKFGGSIAKLDGWGGPQWHNPVAVLKVGMDAWIKYIMPLLNREKMVNQLTGAKLSDAELIEGLGVAWKRIVSEGHLDEGKIEGVPVGRGALWSQHADHRFLHFKSADDWMAYAKRFGNPDPWAAYMSWVKTMARDIAAMDKFGPNPDLTVKAIQQRLMADAMSLKPTEVLIREEKALREKRTGQLRTLQAQMFKPNPEWQELTIRHGQILDTLNDLRHTYNAMIYRASTDDRSVRAKQYADQKQVLHVELQEITDKLRALEEANAQTTLDAVIHQQYRDLLEEMSLAVTTEPIRFAEVANPADYARASIEKTNTLWDSMRGANGVAVNYKMAEIGQIARSWVSLTLLPTAVLSALADPVFQSAKRMLMGMGLAKSNHVTVLADSIRYMSTQNRRMAAQSYVIAESTWNIIRQESTEATRLAKTRVAVDYLGDRVHAVGLLSPYTQGSRNAMQMATMAQFANAVGQTWDKLDPDLRNTLERSGFDASGWDKIRRAKLYEPYPDAKFLRANEIQDVAPELWQRYVSMFQGESRYGVIEPTPESLAFVRGSSKPGTPSGEALRAVGSLKGFPIAVLFQWWGQMSNDLRAGNHRSAAATAASLMIGGAFVGAFTLAMKDMAAGRDPRKWLDEDTYLDGNFWLAAMLQAGGLGIYGDFLFSEVNRSGGSLGQTLAGPVVDRIESLKRLTVDNVIQAARGKDTHVMRELFRVLRQNTPTVLWNKLLMERMVWDRLQLMSDPEARQQWQADRAKRKREYGQDFWFGPGDLNPQRAPDLSRTFATRK